MSRRDNPGRSGLRQDVGEAGEVASGARARGNSCLDIPKAGKLLAAPASVASGGQERDTRTRPLRHLRGLNLTQDLGIQQVRK